MKTLLFISPILFVMGINLIISSARGPTTCMQSGLTLPDNIGSMDEFNRVSNLFRFAVATF